MGTQNAHQSETRVTYYKIFEQTKCMQIYKALTQIRLN